MPACDACKNIGKKYIRVTNRTRRQNRLLLLHKKRQPTLHREDRSLHSIPCLPDHGSTSALAGCHRSFPSCFGGAWLGFSFFVPSNERKTRGTRCQCCFEMTFYASSYVLCGVRVLFVIYRKRASPTRVQNIITVSQGLLGALVDVAT